MPKLYVQEALMLSIPQAYKRPALRLLVCFETLQCRHIIHDAHALQNAPLPGYSKSP